MLYKIIFSCILIILTILFVSVEGVLLSMSSWIANIIGLILLPIYFYYTSKLIFKVYGK